MKKSILSIAFLCMAHFVFAWGNTAHRAIAEIAYDNLTKKSKRELTKIMDDAYLPLYANFADEVRSATDSLKPLGKLPHYVNIDPEQVLDEILKGNKETAYSVYYDYLGVLANDNASDDERNVALKMLVHLVGDMHQPMHCGRYSDLGGNKVKIKWFGTDSNLHRVWDSAIVNHYNLSYTELAVFSEKVSQVDVKEVRDDEPKVWLAESHELANEIYATVGDAKFSYNYPYRYQTTVYEQIEKAGVRLAYIINEALR